MVRINVGKSNSVVVDVMGGTNDDDHRSVIVVVFESSTGASLRT